MKTRTLLAMFIMLTISNFFERAREELIGFKSLRAFYKQEQHFVIKSLTMDFKRPAHHSDKLLIKTKAKLTSSPKSLFRQEAWLIKTTSKLY